MIVIDAHVHLYPPELNAAPGPWATAHGEPHWARLCTRRRRGPGGAGDAPVQSFPSVKALLRELDAAQIDRAVLLGWYWETAAACAWHNRFMAACVRAHPDRLAAFAAVPSAPGPAARETVLRARDAGFRGLGELSPHSQGSSLTASGWREVWHLAGELGLPVNLHVTDPASRPFPGRVETPLGDFLAVAREFPATRFILAHWGGGLAFDPAVRAHANLWFDAAASPLLYPAPPDEAASASVWARAVAAVGGDRLLFGSDHPLRLHPRTEIGSGLGRFVREPAAALRDAEAAAVLGGNLRHLLGW